MQRNVIWVLIVAVIVVGGVLYFTNQNNETANNDQTTTSQTDNNTDTSNNNQASGSDTTTTTDTSTTDTSDTDTSSTDTSTTDTSTTDNTTTSDTNNNGGLAIKNPDTLIYGTLSDIDTLDPHFIYDTASGEIIFHVYDNLITYDGPYTDKFMPMLATEVPSLDNNLIQQNPDGSVIMRFPIREGVQFHNGNDLTPEDVAYSFHRLMLFDRSAGPTWLVLSPLTDANQILDIAKAQEAALNGSVADDATLEDISPEALEAACEVVKQAVQVEDNTVEFHLPRAFPPFLSILAQSASWAAILDQEWVAEQGDWDGSCSNWVPFHDPQKESDPLYENTNGTGPYMLEYWDKASQIVALKRNDNYWQDNAPMPRVEVHGIGEWSTRKLKLLNGDVDLAYVDNQYIDQMTGSPGITLVSKQVRMQLGYVFFNQAIRAEGNNYIGSGALDGEGIPADFFTDIDVRKAFNYLFDWEVYIEQVQKGQSAQASGPIPNGVPFYNADNPTYALDLDKAEEHFKQAWGGEVWEKGFKFTALYNNGNDARKTSMEILRRNLAKVNDKFEMEVINVEWSTFLSKSVDRSIPMYAGGWLEDYHDPHNWVFPFLHSQGTYAGRLGIGPQYDDLINQGIAELDPAKRADIYNELQQLAYDDAVMIFRDQPLSRQYMRSWVDGYYYNPIWPGRNFYVMSKSDAAKLNMEYIDALGQLVESW